MNKKILLILPLIFLLFLVPSVNASLNNSIVSYWSMDENTGSTAYDGVGTNNMTLTSTSWSTDSIINYSVDFGTRGQDYYGTINNNYDYIQNTGVFAISFWWKPNDYADNNYVSIFETNGLSSSNKGIGIYYTLGATSKRMNFQVTRGSSGIVVSSAYDSSYSSNEYVHWVYAGDGTTARLYRNGVSVSNVTIGTLSTGAGTKTIVRVMRDGTASAGQGLLDEIGIWNRSLTSAEVSSLYNSGSGLQYPFGSPIPPTETNITLTAKNNITNAGLTNFSIILLHQTLNETPTEPDLKGWVLNGTTSGTSTYIRLYGNTTLSKIMNDSYRLEFQVAQTAIVYDAYPLEIYKNSIEPINRVWVSPAWNYQYGYIDVESGDDIIFYTGNATLSSIYYIAYYKNDSFNTTNGSINTEILLNNSNLYNISFFSDENGGYYNAEYQNLNLSSGTYQGALAPYFYLFNVTYSNFSLISGANYTRLLSYEYVYTCPSHITTYRAEYVNQTLNTETALTCNNMTNTITRTYSHPIEGAYNITLGMTAPDYEQNTTQRTFISDLYPPVISLFNITTSEGFNPSGYNITLRCYDNIAPSLYYNLTRNSVIIYNASLSNDTLSTQTLTNLDGTHDNIFMCSDNFTTTTALLSNTYYFKQMRIINEKTGNLFPISNMTDARVVFESPAYNTSLNLKTLNTSVFNISSNNTAGRNFRLELEYSTGEIVVRDLNTRYVESNSTICANTNPTTHETQYIISATIKPAIIRSNLHNCYVLADTTRFAYQSNFMAKYYTIPTYYFLNSIRPNGEESLIASVEGGTGSTINLDTLSFGSTLFNVNLRSPSVMIQKHPTSNNTLIIFYYNPKVDNTALDIEIYYNNSLYFSTTTTTSPNNITINFDYTTLSVSDSATFKLVFSATTEEGEENIITTYYSLSGSSGSFPVALGLVLGVMMFISLLTIVSPSFAFGYFGILSTLAGIFIIALSPAVWYSNLFIGVFIIIGIYQFMHFTQTNRTPGGII